MCPQNRSDPRGTSVHARTFHYAPARAWPALLPPGCPAGQLSFHRLYGTRAHKRRSPYHADPVPDGQAHRAFHIH
ncbi:hypothetical protein D3C80_1847160 [compost metagenome]